jgi:hypothetical protein
VELTGVSVEDSATHHVLLEATTSPPTPIDGNVTLLRLTTKDGKTMLVLVDVISRLKIIILPETQGPPGNP